MTHLTQHISALALLAGFLLGVRGEHLALWQGDDPQPICIYSQRVSSLPVADQVLLRRGLRVKDEQALALLLEDYL